MNSITTSSEMSDKTKDQYSRHRSITSKFSRDKREMERKTHIEEKCKMHEQLNRKLLIQLQVSFLILSIFIDTVRFLNLPIWANFVDPTDLSPYYYDHFRPNQFYNMDSTSTST